MNAAPVLPEELPELRAIHLELHHLRTKPFSQVIADPVMLGCLRNVLKARREALAARRRKTLPAVEAFELTP